MAILCLMKMDICQVPMMQHRQNWGMVCVNFWSELDLAPELKTRVIYSEKIKLKCHSFTIQNGFVLLTHGNNCSLLYKPSADGIIVTFAFSEIQQFFFLLFLFVVNCRVFKCR